MTRDSSRTGSHGHRTLRAGMRCPIIAEMRFRAPWVLVTALLALTLPAVAAAEPKPIKKPANIAPIKPANTQTSPPPGESAAEPAGQSARVQQLVVEFEFVHGEDAAGEQFVSQHDVARV